MFDLKTRRLPVWPAALTPINEGEFNKENFGEWWNRHEDTLKHLHSLICEQWIHRHWTHSPFAFLPLDDLSWHVEKMTPHEVFDLVHREFAQTLNPDFDLGVFQKPPLGEKLPTAAAIDEGTWDFPIVTLRVPNGIIGLKGEFPDVRLVLVEGHQRHRYLHALHAFGKAPNGPHDVFILESRLVTGYEKFSSRDGNIYVEQN